MQKLNMQKDTFYLIYRKKMKHLFGSLSFKVNENRGQISPGFSSVSVISVFIG